MPLSEKALQKLAEKHDLDPALVRRALASEVEGNDNSAAMRPDRENQLGQSFLSGKTIAGCDVVNGMLIITFLKAIVSNHDLNKPYSTFNSDEKLPFAH